MQEVFLKKINLSPKCLSIYERLKQLNQIKSLNKSEEHRAALQVSYKRLASEFQYSTQQIRRYLVELEKAELIQRFLIPSGTNIGMCIQILDDEKGNKNKKGAAR